MKNNFFLKWVILFVTYFGFTLAGCLFSSGGEQGSGGGTDTEISYVEVSGKIYTASGALAAHTQLWLIPDSYLPLVHNLPANYQSTTNGEGGYKFLKVDTGSYHLEAFDSLTGQRTFIRGIKVIKNISLSNATLKPAGTVILKLPDSLVTTGGTIYLPGMLRVWPIKSGQINVVLDSLPEGKLPPIYFQKSGSVAKDIIVSDSLQILSGDTLNTGIFALWKQNATIILNTSPTGASILNDVHNFPLLLKLSSAELNFLEVKKDGADLRFAKSNGESLAHSVESWDPLNQTASIWINVDTLFGNLNSQYLRMFWGRADAPSLSPTTNAFDTSLGVVGVWHFDATVSGSHEILDASMNKNNFAWSGSGSPTFLTNGIIGSALSLNGIEGKLISKQQYPAPQVFSISLWFKTNTQLGGRIVDFSELAQDTNFRDHDRQIWMDGNGKVSYGVFSNWGDTSVPTPEKKVITSTKSFNDNAWHHVAASLSSHGQILIIDGEVVGSLPLVTRASTLKGRWTMGFGEIGDWQPWTSANYFQGEIDEVQILHREVSIDWLQLIYLNQSHNTKLVHFGTL